MSVLIMQAGLLARSGQRPIDPDAQSILDRMIPEPDTALKERVNSLVVALKNPALWGVDGALFGRLDSLFVPVGAQNEQSGLLDWRRNVSAQLVNDTQPAFKPTWSAEKGFISGASSSARVESSFRPDGLANWKISDASLTIIATSTITSVAAASGEATSTGSSRIAGTTLGTNIGTRINGRNASPALAPISAGDAITISTSGSSSLAIKNGVGTVVTGGGVALPINNICPLDGNTIAAESVGLIACGASIVAAEQATLKSLYEAYVSA